jgi:chemotaxis protein MotB
MAGKREKKHECVCKLEAGSGRWMLTYLDMVTLLFGVFVLMYAMSSVNKAKFEQVAESIRMGFQGGFTIFQGDKAGGKTLNEFLKPEGTKAKELFNKFVSLLREEINNKNLHIKEEEGGIIISLTGDLYFRPGSADMTPEAERVLDKISPLLQEVQFYIRVEGHTDEAPVDENTLLDNWQLAALRSANVVRFLQFVGVEPRKMSAVSFGQYRPILEKQNTPEDRAYERRVDIVIPTDKAYIYKQEKSEVTE